MKMVIQLLGLKIKGDTTIVFHVKSPDRLVLKNLGKICERLLSFVGLIAIMNYANEHWPLMYQLVTIGFFITVGTFYFWKFIIQPFREGLRS